jgi:hypothetical protein
VVALLVTAAALLGLLVLALALPLVVEFRLEGGAPVRGQVSVRGLAGLARFRSEVPSVRSSPEGRRRSRKRKPERGSGPERASPRRRGRARRVVSLLRERPFRDRVLRLARDLLQAVEVEDLRVRARIGTGDPADTGRLWAILGPVSAVLSGIRGADVELQPEFLDAVLEVQASGRVTVVPLRMLALAAGFALSPRSFQAWRSLAAGRA